MDELLPLWKAFPDIPYKSIGWRMGAGEDYIGQFNKWFRDLSDAERAAFEKKHPEPKEWAGYYEAFRAAIPKLRELEKERLQREKK